MKHLIFVRPLTEAERQALGAGLRSAAGFTLRRCQILLASAEGTSVPAIAASLRCNRQTVRNAIHAFNQTGRAALSPSSSRPHTIHAAFPGSRAEQVRELLHRSPRDFGKPTSVWTLALAAEVSFAQGLTPTPVSPETIRATLGRLDVRWRRAKQWITSPDPAYLRKKAGATGCSGWPRPIPPGCLASRMRCGGVG
ncbi:MAG TPA: helix-turn-helix domain-containing protein [Candidatus Dormibacteraeota bacterium]|nr:helix-turn-helix domain-containing protein [Candidatus Dormibacteraeota bacterium]